MASSNGTSPLLGIVVVQLGILILTTQGATGDLVQVVSMVFGLGAVVVTPFWLLLAAYDSGPSGTETAE
ncbi:hypothetical protein [Haloarchaeobius iranensis]|uniref:Uncharacterized protein n=1 Tax=Haloarchaeobius iranensis TaxID=996166 RepID=A0A1G9VIK6_9EURY|nr:hypothetical protein [Haloarchaeobius iranensis]SDM71645.1 hypothetical protein SAMN05192554_106119 [Haloarchaeobius iranensis]